jgi:hypothetical protein
MASGLPRHGGKGVTHRAFDVTNHNLGHGVGELSVCS